MARLKLTRKLIDRAYELIKAPNYAITVYKALGISEGTYYNWLKAGEEAEASIAKGEKPSGANANLYLEFLRSIKKGEAEGEQKLLAVIETASKRNWTAAAWMLERMHPDRYGRFERIQHEGVPDKPITIKWKMIKPGDE